MLELAGRAPPEERTPYVNVAFQEAGRMNRLLGAIKHGLRETLLGLKGELTVTPTMEAIENALYFNNVPPSWGVILGPSTKPLAAWFIDLLERYVRHDLMYFQVATCASMGFSRHLVMATKLVAKRLYVGLTIGKNFWTPGVLIYPFPGRSGLAGSLTRKHS